MFSVVGSASRVIYSALPSVSVWPFLMLFCVGGGGVPVPPDVCDLWRCVASEMLGDYVDCEGCCAGRRRLGVQVPPVGPHSPMFLLCAL